MNPEIFCKLNPKSIKIETRTSGGKPELTPADIAATLTGLHDRYYWAVMARIAGDLPQNTNTVESIIDRSINDALKIYGDKKLKKYELSNMVWLAYYELAFPRQVDNYIKKSFFIQVDAEDFKKRLNHHYEDIYSMILDYSNTAIRQAKKKLEE